MAKEKSQILQKKNEEKILIQIKICVIWTPITEIIMCDDKYLFSDYELFKDTIKLGNNAKMTIVGKGNIKLKIGGNYWAIVRRGIHDHYEERSLQNHASKEKNDSLNYYDNQSYVSSTHPI
ncbi:hypothetical protein CR513_03302, partial [Mucuna pruriens]